MVIVLYVISSIILTLSPLITTKTNFQISGIKKLQMFGLKINKYE